MSLANNIWKWTGPAATTPRETQSANVQFLRETMRSQGSHTAHSQTGHHLAQLEIFTHVQDTKLGVTTFSLMRQCLSCFIVISVSCQHDASHTWSPG